MTRVNMQTTNGNEKIDAERSELLYKASILRQRSELIMMIKRLGRELYPPMDMWVDCGSDMDVCQAICNRIEVDYCGKRGNSQYECPMWGQFLKDETYCRDFDSEFKYRYSVNKNKKINVRIEERLKCL